MGLLTSLTDLSLCEFLRAGVRAFFSGL